MVRIADALSKAESERSDVEKPKGSTVTDQDFIASLSPQANSQPSKTTNARSSSVAHKWDKRLTKAVNEEPHVAEIFKNLRSRILHPSDPQTGPKSVIVLSAAPNEGKSFVTANLGISIAMSLNHYCLMVDCDLRRPTLSDLFGVENNYGLVNYLLEEHDLEELMTGTSLDNLTLLPSGKSPPNPAELLGSARMRSLVIELSDRYADRIILFDCPPTLSASETLVLAGQVDGVVVVVREAGASKTQIKKLIASIDSDKLLGIVFNGHTTNILERSLLDSYSGYSGYY